MDITSNFALVLEQLKNLLLLPLNRVFILAVTSQVASMITKVIITSFKTKKLSFENMAKYGGMPSSHTVFITAFVFGVGFDPNFGWTHPLFALGFIVSSVVIVDAVRLRGTVDKLNDVLKVVADHDPQLSQKINLPKKIAHTGPEVIGGIIFAFLYTMVFYLFFYGLFDKILHAISKYQL